MAVKYDAVTTTSPTASRVLNPTDGSNLLPRFASRPARVALCPGTYRFELDSFCLHAGSHGPSKLWGYLHGPFRGRRAELLQQVIRRYTVTPTASRQETQALLWSILARSDLSSVTGPAREAADKLLTPQELAELGGGPWASLPDELRRRIRKQLSPAQRAIFDAEDKLRDLVVRPTASCPA